MKLESIKSKGTQYTERRTVPFTREIDEEFRRLEFAHGIKITRWIRMLAEENLPELKRKLEESAK